MKTDIPITDFLIKKALFSTFMTKSSREDCINLAILLIDKNANTRPVSSPVLQTAISLWKTQTQI